MNTTPTGHKYWLKQHQITAFWHGFGISNGLTVPIEEVETVTYTKGTPRKVYKVSAKFMQSALNEYINWLENYKKTWNAEDKHPFGIDTREAFMEDEKAHESRMPIIKMIELLQECAIKD